MIITRISDFGKHKFRHNRYLEKLIDEVDTYYKLSSADLDILRKEKFVKLLKHALKRSVFYDQLYSNLKEKKFNSFTLAELKDLPVIDKDLIRNEFNKILTGSKLTVRRTETTGTTGSPLKVYRDYKSIMLEHAYQWRH